MVYFERKVKFSPTHRMLFRNVENALDEKDFELAIKQRENDYLKTELELLKSKKKKKVDIDPNTKFAGIKAIRKAQLAASAGKEGSNQSDATEDDETLENCIVAE